MSCCIFPSIWLVFNNWCTKTKSPWGIFLSNFSNQFCDPFYLTQYGDLNVPFILQCQWPACLLYLLPRTWTFVHHFFLADHDLQLNLPETGILHIPACPPSHHQPISPYEGGALNDDPTFGYTAEVAWFHIFTYLSEAICLFFRSHGQTIPGTAGRLRATLRGPTVTSLHWPWDLNQWPSDHILQHPTHLTTFYLAGPQKDKCKIWSVDDMWGIPSYMYTLISPYSSLYSSTSSHLTVPS